VKYLIPILLILSGCANTRGFAGVGVGITNSSGWENHDELTTPFELGVQYRVDTLNEVELVWEHYSQLLTVKEDESIVNFFLLKYRTYIE
jgi:hypothetical protein